jgi:hypothetical protein
VGGAEIQQRREGTRLPAIALDARVITMLFQPNTLLTAALGYAARGWPVIPLHGIVDGKCTCHRGADCGKSSGKHPRIVDWVDAASTDPAQIDKWWRDWPDANVGLVTGRKSGLFVIDTDGDDGEASLDRLEERIGKLPETQTARTARGYHYYLSVPSDHTMPGNSSGGKDEKGLDTRGEGGLVVAPPSGHLSGTPYEWESDNVEVVELPAAYREWAINRSAARNGSDAGASLKDAFSEYASKVPDITATFEKNPPLGDILAAASLIPNDDEGWDGWNTVIMEIFAASDGSEDGLRAAHLYSAKSPKYNRRTTDERWKTLTGSPPTRTNFGAMINRVREVLPHWQPPSQASGTGPQGGKSKPTWRGQSKSGEPRNTLHNARVALNALGVKCRYDIFQSRIWMGFDGDVSHELQQVVGEISDDAIIALRRIASDEFRANFTDQVMLDGVRSIALENQYDPVRDELDAAEAAWDGQERLDRMAVDYVNAADTRLNRAFIRKTMIAAVRRVRQPGVKYDTITVLESPEGWNKSGFWRVLAGDEYYSDQSIMGQQAREVQEQLSTIWIHENAELAGMRKTDVEVVKAYASRQVDIARPAYGRVVRRQPRHSIDVATTNNTNYLRSQTGNRRFWPIKVLAPIDLQKLKRDRLQLLGEAATYESRGEEITLGTDLWRDAAIEQDARRVQDAWEDILADMPTHAVEDPNGNVETFTLAYDQREEPGYIRIVHREDGLEKVASATVIRYVLQMRHDRLPENIAMRLSAVMKQLGWERPENKINIGGKQVRGYVRPLPEGVSNGDENS